MFIKPMEIQICNISQISLFHQTTNSRIVGEVQLAPNRFGLTLHGKKLDCVLFTMGEVHIDVRTFNANVWTSINVQTSTVGKSSFQLHTRKSPPQL